MPDVPWLNYLREFNLLSVFVRLTLSVLLSGVVGFQRELKGQPAGLRTHMLVCLGSALAIMTNMYIARMYSIVDPTRIAAQVISGIGFLGAGAIVVTGRFHRQVRGLTTAAGLWSSACMGIALGSGFYEGALVAFGLMMVIIALLTSLDERIRNNKRTIQIYAEFIDAASASGFIRELRRMECIIDATEIMPKGAHDSGVMSAFLVVRYPIKSMDEKGLLSRAQEIEGVLLVENF